MPSKFCDIKNLKPSDKTTKALEELEKVLQLTKALEALSIFGALYNLFAGKATRVPSAASQAANIKMYDWERLHGAMKGIDTIKRSRVELIIVGAMLDTSGEEKKFWQCMRNTLN